MQIYDKQTGEDLGIVDLEIRDGVRRFEKGRGIVLERSSDRGDVWKFSGLLSSLVAWYRWTRPPLRFTDISEIIGAKEWGGAQEELRPYLATLPPDQTIRLSCVLVSPSLPFRSPSLSESLTVAGYKAEAQGLLGDNEAIVSMAVPADLAARLVQTVEIRRALEAAAQRLDEEREKAENRIDALEEVRRLRQELNAVGELLNPEQVDMIEQLLHTAEATVFGSSLIDSPPRGLLRQEADV